jgi:hypothetical protein
MSATHAARNLGWCCKSRWISFVATYILDITIKPADHGMIHPRQWNKEEF